MDDIPAQKNCARSAAPRASESSKKPLRVVGIGAGAGGLEAVQLLFGAMPVDAGLAFIICRRLQSGLVDPLADLLRTQTVMPVIQAEDGTKLDADHIYLLPPNVQMVLLKEKLVSFIQVGEGDGDEEDLAVSPIDLMLHSVAASVGSSAIAIVLSGNDHDGLRGCASVRRFGGLVLAQHPQSTDYIAMPQRVIDADLASAIAPPGAMPDLIWRHIGKERPRSGETCCTDAEDKALARIIGLLKARFAIDAHAYRPTLVAKRVRRRLGMSDVTTLADYADLLTSDDAELLALHDDLLIGVTAFFRDPEAFAILKSEVAPVLVERMTSDRPIRVWVPACASGEEAYSLAMLLLDQIERVEKHPELEILASDRHARALKRARHGRYRRKRLDNVPTNLIDRYMLDQGDHLEVGPALRRHVTFVDRDLLDTPPPDDIDLVSCRNLLIYFATGSREKALLACCDALKPDGFLFLGPSEQPGPLMTGLTTIHRKWRIYRKAASPLVDDATTRLATAQKRARAEPILPSETGLVLPIGLRPSDATSSDDVDGMMAENQHMLESTIGTLLASNDALRRRNRDLRAENLRLTNAHAALDDVATMIAHDLKAPLRTIDHLVGRIKEAVSAESGQKGALGCLQPMQHQLIGLDRLIDDLLTYARQGSPQTVDLARVDVGDLLRETLTLIGLPKGVKVLMRPPSLQIMTWRIPLACILRNLLGQAIERIGGASGGIQIDAKPAELFLGIEIVDDGQNAIEKTGGLGLAIVRQLLEAAGGQLTSSPDPGGRGHQVRFTWPIESAATPEVIGEASPPP